MLSRRTRAALAAAAAAAAVLAGCGDPTKKARASQPVAARVNGEAITVPQVEFVLQQQRGLRPEQAEAASRVVLERLIHQELAVQRAGELGLERDARVQLQLDAARREVLARAYAEHVGAGAAKPSDDELRRYYDEHPWLFRQRRVYQLQEFAIEAKPEQVDALRAQLEATRHTGEFAEWLRANGYRFALSQAVRAAEQLPPAVAKSLAALADGQALFNASANGAQIVVRAGSREQPLEFDAARPAIEQLMLAERRRALVRDDLLAQRRSAKIEYLGAFAASPPPAVDPAASDVLPEAPAR